MAAYWIGRIGGGGLVVAERVTGTFVLLAMDVAFAVGVPSRFGAVFAIPRVITAEREKRAAIANSEGRRQATSRALIATAMSVVKFTQPAAVR